MGDNTGVKGGKTREGGKRTGARAILAAAAETERRTGRRRQERSLRNGHLLLNLLLRRRRWLLLRLCTACPCTCSLPLCAGLGRRALGFHIEPQTDEGTVKGGAG